MNIKRDRVDNLEQHLRLWTLITLQQHKLDEQQNINTSTSWTTFILLWKSCCLWIWQKSESCTKLSPQRIFPRARKKFKKSQNLGGDLDRPEGLVSTFWGLVLTIIYEVQSRPLFCLTIVLLRADKSSELE